MPEHADCPLGCGWDDYADDPRDLWERIREHILWAHYTPREWGDVPNGVAACAFLVTAGYITIEQAQTVLDEESGAVGLGSARYAAHRYFTSVVNLLWSLWCFGYGFMEGYLFLHGAAWYWTAIAAFAIGVAPLVVLIATGRSWRSKTRQPSVDTR